MPRKPESRHRRTDRQAPEQIAFRLRLFDLPRVERSFGSGFEPVSWPLRRALQILAYLAVQEGGTATRQELAEAIWPDSDSTAIARNFHPTISRLRRTLQPVGRAWGAAIRLRDGVYSLDASIDWQVDVREFRDKLRAGESEQARDRRAAALEQWRQAWRLYSGPFLRGHDDPWIVDTRRHLRRLYLRLLSAIGDTALELDEWTTAEDAYRSLLLEDPLQELVYVALMRIYSRRGRPDLVQRQYQRLCKLLRTELGIEPSAATLEAYNRCLL